MFSSKLYFCNFNTKNNHRKTDAMKKCFIVFQLLLSSFLNAQQYSVFINDTLVFKSSKDSISIILDKRLENSKNNGFLEAYFDDGIFNNDSSSFHVKYYSGELFKIFFTNAKDFNINLNAVISFQLFEKELDKLLLNYQQKGFLFAKIIANTVKVDSNIVYYEVLIENKYSMAYFNVKNVSKEPINEFFLSRILNIPNIYDKNNIKLINKQLEQQQLFKVNAPTFVLFKDSTAIYHFNLSKQKSSIINGIVGLIQSQTQKLALTGLLNLKLNNLAGRGELFNINWKNTDQTSQNLDVNIKVPYLYKNLGINTLLNIIKQDTTYIIVEKDFKISFQKNLQHNISIGVNKRNNTYIPQNKSFLTSSTTSYKLGYGYKNLDYIVLLKKGCLFEFEGIAGKRLLRDSTNLQLGTNILFNIAYVITPKISIFNAFNMNYIYSTKILNESEYSRMGGANNLRGFNEDYFKGSLISYYSQEWRYFIEPYSYLYLFGNIGYAKSAVLKTKALGFGGGIALFLDNSIVNISFAIGKEQNNPLQLRSAKVHISTSFRF